ncbi:MAG: hypothetical protein ACFB3T_03430 [Geminicoccaceae bacterium]
MFEVVLQLIGSFDGHFAWQSFLVCLALALFATALLLSKPKSRARIESWLKADDAIGPYRRVVGGILDRIDAWLTPYAFYDDEERAKAVGRAAFGGPSFVKALLLALLYPIFFYDDEEKAKAVGRAAFGWPLFDKALLFALLYPIFLLIGIWAWSGHEGLIGGLPVLPEDPAGLWPPRADEALWRARILVIALLAYLVLLALYFRPNQWRAWKRALAIGLAFALAVALAVAVAVAVAARRGYGVIAYLALVAVGLAALAAAVWLAGAARDDDLSALIVFLGVLPLVNGLFDYGSLGVTRWLLRRGMRTGGHPVLTGIADAAAALVFFTLLGVTLIGVLHGLNQLSATPVLDLSALFTDLRDPARRWDYLWLYAMLFSTAVPTLLHVMVAMFGLISLVVRPIRGWIYRQVQDRAVDGVAFICAHGSLAAIYAFAVWTPCFLIYWGGAFLVEYHPMVLLAYLNVFEDFALWIGAAVEVQAPGFKPFTAPEMIWT